MDYTETSPKRQQGTAKAHEALDLRLRLVIDENPPARVVGSGFTFTVGPIWHPVEHHLLFSDMPTYGCMPGYGVERPRQLGNQFTKFDPI